MVSASRDAIKLEVVEFGGDNLLNTGHSLTVVGTPSVAAACYPDLVASAMCGRTQPHGRVGGGVGTSFATPKVSRIAAELQTVLPDECCLLYRAIIVQSVGMRVRMKRAEDADRYLDRQQLHQGIVLWRTAYGVVGHWPHFC